METFKKLLQNIQIDDYTTSCLLDYFCLKELYKLIATDLGKQQALNTDPKAIKQVNFTGNIDKAENATIF